MFHEDAIRHVLCRNLQQDAKPGRHNLCLPGFDHPGQPEACAVSGCVPHLPELIQNGRILIRDLFYGGNGEELIE